MKWVTLALAILTPLSKIMSPLLTFINNVFFPKKKQSDTLERQTEESDRARREQEEALKR